MCVDLADVGNVMSLGEFVEDESGHVTTFIDLTLAKVDQFSPLGLPQSVAMVEVQRIQDLIRWKKKMGQ